MNIVICGSRNFGNYVKVKEVMDAVIDEVQHLGEEVKIISGGARGADTLADLYAQRHKIPFTLYKAEWSKYGNKAGIIRNIEMAKVADVVVAFWDGGSRGTKHMIEYCKENGIKVSVVRI